MSNTEPPTAYELICNAISSIYGDDPERAHKATDEIIAALGLATTYHVATPTVEHRGGLTYESQRWQKYLRLSDIAEDWPDEPRLEIWWSVSSARHPQPSCGVVACRTNGEDDEK